MIATQRLRALVPPDRPVEDAEVRRRDLTARLILAREGSCADRWGSWGTRERLQDRPKL